MEKQLLLPQFIQGRCLTLDPIETPFNTYAIRVDPDQAALIRIHSVSLWKILYLILTSGLEK